LNGLLLLLLPFDVPESLTIRDGVYIACLPADPPAAVKCGLLLLLLLLL